MSVTDELRKWARQFRRIWVDPHSGDLTYISNEHACPPSLDAVRLEDHITAIADRIDERVTELLRKQDADLRAEFDLMNDGWTRLPVDADGEPVHVGDVMEWPNGETFEVVGIGDGTLFYVEGDNDTLADWTGASTKHHHHTPTIEDVLCEFATKMSDAEDFECDPEKVQRELIAEYATMLGVELVMT